MSEVALAYQLGAPHQERITQGILRYAQENGPWDLVSSPEGAAIPLGSLREWNGKGIIAMLETRELVDTARKLRVPVVNLTTALRTPDIVTVAGDNPAMGAMAAEHLLSRNFRRFGYYGLGDTWYSAQREQGFRETVEAAGFPCSTHVTLSSLLSPTPWKLDRTGLKRWLAKLETPVGILAVHDYRARMVLESCAELGLSVPGEVAVIGVDDDPVVCGYTDPPLSSVRQDGVTIGWRAAEALDRLMSGERLPREVVTVSPEALVARDSTRVMAVGDPALRRALDLIEEHFADPIDIAWLAERSGVSRRWLERLFRSELDASPREHLARTRLERAKSLLLSEKNHSLAEVAARTGFGEPRRLQRTMMAIEDITPREFQKRERSNS